MREPRPVAGGEGKRIGGGNGEVVQDPFAGADLPVSVAVIEDRCQEHHQSERGAEGDDRRRVDLAGRGAGERREDWALMRELAGLHHGSIWRNGMDPI